jgi:hypothetical protein
MSHCAMRKPDPTVAGNSGSRVEVTELPARGFNYLREQRSLAPGQWLRPNGRSR